MRIYLSLATDAATAHRHALRVSGLLETWQQQPFGRHGFRVEVIRAPRSSRWMPALETPSQPHLFFWLRVEAVNATLAQAPGQASFKKMLGNDVLAPGIMAFSRLSPFTLLLAQRRLNLCSWWEVQNPLPLPPAVVENQREDVRHCVLACSSYITAVPEEDLKTLPVQPVLKLLSFDIECVSVARQFPNAGLLEDRVCTIGVAEQDLQQTTPGKSTVFVSDPTTMDPAKIDTGFGAIEVVRCPDEAELLARFGDHVRHSDADIITGYNIDGFDWNYISQRVTLLQAHGCMTPLQAQRALSLSRRGLCRLNVPGAKRLQSAAFGDQMLVAPRTVGRIDLDLWLDRKRDNNASLPDFKLNTLSRIYLNQQKHDIDAQTLFRYVLEGSDAERGDVAAYCLQDCWLVLRLLLHVDAVTALLEMSVITNVCTQDLIHCGQSVKIYSMIAIQCLLQALPLEDTENARETSTGTSSAYEGAMVLEPKTGFYTKPVVVLDFQSLYPSIMRTLNVSFDTLIADSVANSIDSIDSVKSPTVLNRIMPGPHRFVSTRVHKGIIPIVLETLLDARRRAKAQYKEATGARRRVLHARQLGLKISANSVYGFFGSEWCPISTAAGSKCIAEATTAAARAVLEMTQEHVLRKYPKAVIVYGDTDSIFVDVTAFLSPDATAFTVGQEIAHEVTHWFTKELQEHAASFLMLEFEKLLQPFCLLRKKRYFGLAFETEAELIETRRQMMEETSEDHGNQSDISHLCVKGIELVRRDAAPVVRSTQSRVLQRLLRLDLPGALACALHASEQILALKPGGPFTDVVQSKTLRSKYQQPESLPHVQLSRRLTTRAASNAPRCGDRIDFVVLASQNARVLDAIECPLFAARHGLPPAWDHYLEHLHRAIGSLLEVPLASEPVLFDKFKNTCAEHLRRASVLVRKHGVARLEAKDTWVMGLRSKHGGTGVQLSLVTMMSLRQKSTDPASETRPEDVPDQ
jgi:DNA polymerase delta subunit 1